MYGALGRVVAGKSLKNWIKERGVVELRRLGFWAMRAVRRMVRQWF